MDYFKIANEQLKLIGEKLVNENGELIYKKKDSIASLWDYSAYFTAVIKAYKIDRNNRDILDATLERLEWYLSKNRKDDYLVYASLAGEETPVFYDDNVWLAIGFLELYEIDRNELHLEKAQKIMKFIMNSWQEHLGGGLLWREFPKSLDKAKKVRNTCINAPASYALARLSQLTNIKEYLYDSIKVYNWTKKVLKDPNSNLYFDNISETNVIEETKWSYNVGVMISAGSLLYHLTEDITFYNDAINSIKSSYKLMFKGHEDNSKHMYVDDHPWFRVYLFQGYVDAYQYLDDDDVEVVFNKVLEGFNYLYKKYQPDNQLLINDWSLLPEKNSVDNSLFASGNLESVCLFTEFLNLKRKGEH